MRLIIKDDILLATHADDQDIDLAVMYPSATEMKTVRDDLEIYKSEVLHEGTEHEVVNIVFKSVSELNLQPSDEKVVRIIDGGKISQSTLDIFNAASTVEELKTILSTILTGTP